MLQVCNPSTRSIYFRPAHSPFFHLDGCPAFFRDGVFILYRFTPDSDDFLMLLASFPRRLLLKAFSPPKFLTELWLLLYPLFVTSPRPLTWAPFFSETQLPSFRRELPDFPYHLSFCPILLLFLLMIDQLLAIFGTPCLFLLRA